MWSWQAYAAVGAFALWELITFVLRRHTKMGRIVYPDRRGLFSDPPPRIAALPLTKRTNTALVAGAVVFWAISATAGVLIARAVSTDPVFGGFAGVYVATIATWLINFVAVARIRRPSRDADNQPAAM